MDYTYSLARTVDGDSVSGSVSGSLSDVSRVVAKDIAVPDGSSDLEVDLAAVAIGKCKLFALTATAYDDTDFSVKYAGSGNPANTIPGPIIFTEGNISMMDFAPSKLFLTNNTGALITIRAELVFDPS